MKKLIAVALAVTSTLAFAGAPLGTGTASPVPNKKSAPRGKIVASEKPTPAAGTSEDKVEKTRATGDEKR